MNFFSDENNNKEFELVLDCNENNKKKDASILSSIPFSNCKEEANIYCNNDLNKKNEFDKKLINQNSLNIDVIKYKRSTLNRIKATNHSKHCKSISFQGIVFTHLDVNHLIPTTDDDKSAIKIEDHKEFNTELSKRKSAIFTINHEEIPALSQKNYTLKTKLFEKYLSDDEPANTIPLKITKNKLEEMLNNKYFSTYNVNYSAREDDKKIEEKFDSSPKEKDLGHNFTSVKRFVSDINTIHLPEIHEKLTLKDRENSLKKDELTLDRIAYDINKQHISFNRRRTDEAINRKSAYFRNKIMILDKEKGNLTENKFSRKYSTEYKKVINIDIDKKNNHFNLWKRVRVMVIVIESIFFLQKDMKLYGLRTTKCDYNFLNVDDYIDHDVTKYSICFNDIEIQNNNITSALPIYIILPGGFFNKLWKRIVFFNLFIFIIIYPFRIGFYNDKYLTHQSMFFLLDIINELIFLIDFILQFFTAYYDEDGNLECDLLNILVNYAYSWLFVDFVCLIPLTFLRINFRRNKMMGELLDITKILKFMRVFKFGMTVNHIKFIDKFQEFVQMHHGIVKLIYFFFNSILLCYTFACLWHFSAIVDYSNENWIGRSRFLDDSKWTIFLKSIYFGYTVFITIGYGDIVPYTTSLYISYLVEIILVLLWMYICAVFYTFSLTSLSNVFLESNSNNLKINNKCLIIDEIFRASKLNNLIQKTILHLKRNQDKEENYSYRLKDIRNLLSEMPNSVKVEIARTMYDNSFQKIKIFRDLKSRSFIANIIPLLQSYQMIKDNVIYSVDEIPEKCKILPKKVYFIGSGSVCFTTHDNIVYQTLHEGSYFGEIEILRKTYRESNVLTKENCQLLTLTKKIILNDILNNYYEFFQILLKNMVKRWNFFVDIMNTIDTIINEGKNLFNNELANIVKFRLKIGFDMTNFNKYYFGIGILNRLEQLKKKNNDNNRVDYNLEAINDVFSAKEIIDEVLVKRKVSRKTKPHTKPTKIEIADIEEDIADDKGKVLISKKKSEKLLVKNIMYKQTVLKENKEILSLLNSFHTKLNNFIDNKHKQVSSDRNSRIAETISLLSINNPEPRKSIYKKLNSFQKFDSKKSLKLDKIDSKLFCRTLKTLNFDIQNETNGKNNEECI